MAAQLLTLHKSTRKVFFVNNQAALLVIDSMELYSHLVWECVPSLGELAKHNEVILCWVKAYVGHELNKEADALAKEGVGMEVVEPQSPKLL